MRWGHAAIRLDGCVHVGRPFNGDDLIFFILHTDSALSLY